MHAGFFLAMMESASFTPEAESLAIYAAFTTPPTDARKQLIDTAVKSLKSAGVWSKLDALWITAAADSQAAKINWVAPGTYNLTAVNSPSFTADRGFMSDGSTSYLNSGIAANALTHYVQNSAMLFAWNTGEHAGNNDRILGSDNNFLQLNMRQSSNGAVIRINDNAGLGSSDIGTALGSMAANRSGATARQVYRNGAAQASDTQASVALGAWSMWLLRHSSVYATADQVGAGAVGASLTATEHQALHDAVNAYMVGVGAA